MYFSSQIHEMVTISLADEEYYVVKREKVLFKLEKKYGKHYDVRKIRNVFKTKIH